MVGHMVRHVDQPDQGGLKPPNPEVFHQPAVARLVHVHPHKQDLGCENTRRQRQRLLCRMNGGQTSDCDWSLFRFSGCVCLSGDLLPEGLSGAAEG